MSLKANNARPFSENAHIASNRRSQYRKAVLWYARNSKQPQAARLLGQMDAQ
jgi:hypothetical protein